MEDCEVNNTPEHIAEYIEGTIKRLGSTPDLYYLHRIDPKQDLEASITALDKLKKEGKTKYIGLSECNAQTLRKACSCKLHSPLPDQTGIVPANKVRCTHRRAANRVFTLVRRP